MTDPTCQCPPAATVGTGCPGTPIDRSRWLWTRATRQYARMLSASEMPDDNAELATVEVSFPRL